MKNNPILVVHLVYRLDIGGLETVVVNLINHLPHEEFRHVVISLTQSSDFKKRITAPNVGFYQLNKKAGKDLMVWLRLFKLLRNLKPDILHTCNLAALEGVIPARLAGVPVVIHAEHGRDSYDIDGSNKKYLLLRRFLLPFADHVIAVSQDLASWLAEKVKITPGKIKLIINGIESTLPPRNKNRPYNLPNPPDNKFANSDSFIIGTVGRLWPVKDQSNLIRAFALLVDICKEDSNKLRLVIVGDGPQREELEKLACELGINEKFWITGWRNDVGQLLRRMDLFALPSQAEGTPLTIIEAMAAALPVVATNVGGVANLVIEGKTGFLVPPQNHQDLAQALYNYINNPSLGPKHGSAAREYYLQKFTLEHMVHQYKSLFRDSLAKKIS
ncbi:MAG: TIGR03088 family PEP-CTERM/XrtA system glycosyltransferase [Magnetococcales bacterium]|nr:TIGR03088 family PEP-CTERM/XrtA system glycosyltransferase [Magnetococcales bacterium]